MWKGLVPAEGHDALAQQRLSIHVPDDDGRLVVLVQRYVEVHVQRGVPRDHFQLQSGESAVP